MPDLPTPYEIVNGELVPAGEAGFPVHHQSLVDAFGVYETVLVQDGRFFHLDWHLRRLAESARILGLDLPAPAEEIGGWARKLVSTVESGCGLLRIVSYGSDGVHGPLCGLYVKPCPLHRPERYEQGVAVATSVGERFHPLAKSTNCLAQAMARFHAERQGAHEGLIVDRHGHVTEGSTSSLLVVKDGEVLRPLAGTALEGVTEGITMALAEELDIPVRHVALPRAEVGTWDEAMIASTNRRVMPVRQVDNVVLPWAAGPVTRRLIDAFRAYEQSQGWEA